LKTNPFKNSTHKRYLTQGTVRSSCGPFLCEGKVSHVRSHRPERGETVLCAGKVSRCAAVISLFKLSVLVEHLLLAVN